MRPRSRSEVTYHRLESGLKTTLLYVLIFGLYVYVSNALYALSFYITLVVVVLWGMTLVLCWKAPSQRESSISQGRNFVAGYFLFLIMFRFLIGYFSKITPSALGASISPNISQLTSETSQESLENLLQNIFMIASVSSPVGYGIMMWQKLRHFTVKQSMKQGFDKNKNFMKDFDR